MAISTEALLSKDAIQRIGEAIVSGWYKSGRVTVFGLYVGPRGQDRRVRDVARLTAYVVSTVQSRSGSGMAGNLLADIESWVD